MKVHYIVNSMGAEADSPTHYIYASRMLVTLPHGGQKTQVSVSQADIDWANKIVESKDPSLYRGEVDLPHGRWIEFTKQAIDQAVHGRELREATESLDSKGKGLLEIIQDSLKPIPN